MAGLRRRSHAVERQTHSGDGNTLDEQRPHPSSWGRSAGLLSAATILISVANYGFTLVIVRLLRPSQFSAFVAGQSVLLVVANASIAAIPWAVARYIAIETRPNARSEALQFGLRASLLQAIAAALIAELVLFNSSGPAVATVTALGAALLSMAAGPVGYLQGTERVPSIARFRLVEGTVRIGSGLIAVLLISRTAAMGLVGFSVGAAVMLAISLTTTREAWPLHTPDVAESRMLIGRSLRLGGVQLVMCMLGALDTVAITAANFSARTTASYQAAALLGRIPLFISTAVAVAMYTELTRSPNDEAVGKHLRHSLGFYGAISLPILVACWTVPHALLSLLIPDTYSSAATLLKFTSVSGVAIGLINLLTTAHQARGRFVPALRILAPAAILQPLLLIWLGRGWGITAFSVGLVTLSLVTLSLISWDSRRWLRGASLGPKGILLAVLPLTLAAALVRSPAIWIAVIFAIAGCLVVAANRTRSPVARPAAL